MNDLIIFIIFVIIGMFMIVGGIRLIIDWYKRVDSWDSSPSTDEYFSCLFEGFVGIFCALIGGILFILSITISICLIT